MPIRCLHLLPDTGPGGAESQALYLLQGLRERDGVQLELAYFGESALHADFSSLGIPMHHIPRERRLTFDVRRRASALRRLVGDQPPDVLHTWLYEGNLVGLFAARTWPSTRVIVSERGGFDRSQPLKLRIHRQFLDRADHAIVNSSDGAALLSKIGMPPERITVVPNGVPTERVAVTRSREEIRREVGIPANAPVVGSFGRPDPQKDLACLFAAFDQVRAVLPDARALVVGSDLAALRSLGLEPHESVVAAGWRTDTADLMQAVDVVAISSYTEGYSNVAAEALLLGVPVVTTEVGGHPPVVVDAGGRAVPIRRADLLAEALLDILENPPEGERVRAVAGRTLSAPAMVDSTLAVYRRLLGRPCPLASP